MERVVSSAEPGDARPEVSVCVATYRRPASLARLLESLWRQKLPDGVGLEVIVVDNDPEGTAFHGAAGDAPERWLHEPRRNIAHARNRAVEAARGEWLAFVDDDEVVGEDWLLRYLARAASGGWDGLFGPVLPRLEVASSSWLDVDAFFGRPRQTSGTAVGRDRVRTGNAFVRRRLFEGRRFDPGYGLSGGSDSELFGRMLDAGARFGWCDEAPAEEWIAPAQHSLQWLTRRAFRGGFVHSRLEAARAGRVSSRERLLRALGLGLGLAAFLPVSLLAGRARAARVWLQLCVQAGHVWALTGRHFEEYRQR